jgi:phosphate-selective porin OprO and OprP
LLVQVGGFYQYEQPDGSNGFELSNFRLKFSGEFDKRIGYMVQTAFTGSPAILDARIYYKISKAFVVDAGLYKAPFSREFLISAADIDFVNRAQLTALAPNRQIGVQARGVLPGTVLSYVAAMFNGNRFSINQNDNNEFLYTGRLALNPDITGGANNNEEI